MLSGAFLATVYSALSSGYSSFACQLWDEFVHFIPTKFFFTL